MTGSAGSGPTRLALKVVGALVPGVRRVHDQVDVYAAQWASANARAWRTPERPLWVVLGDSMSQGIGASAYDRGWVGQLADRYDAAGTPVRVVNLSATGARLHDVLHHQLPLLRRLPGRADVVTVLAGANDMLTRGRRRTAPELMRDLIAELPPGVGVVACLPRRNREARALNAVVEQAAADGRIRVADTRTVTVRSLVGSRAEDHFHPNDHGYARLADTFERSMRPVLQPVD